jgi:hypothetical protein
MSDVAPKNGTTEFICKDTGIVLQIKHVPFTVTDMLFRQYEKECPPPTPPLTKIDYGDEKITEPNYAHPAYLRKLVKYDEQKNLWINEQTKRIYTDLAIECEIDPAAVEWLRLTLKKSHIEPDADDKYLFIWQIAVGTIEGYHELVNAIQHRIQPTEESIAQAKDSFPSKV